MADDAKTTLPRVDLASLAYQVAQRFTADVGIVMVRTDDDGRPWVDMGGPESAEFMEIMAIALVESALERSRQGAEAGCGACAERAPRLEHALKILAEDLEAEEPRQPAHAGP